MKKYHWMSEVTGEVVTNIWSMFKAIWIDVRYSHFINLKWIYSREGF